MGVSEMTRFGMEQADFKVLASFVGDVILKDRKVIEKVKALRAPFRELRFCFSEEQSSEIWNRLRDLV